MRFILSQPNSQNISYYIMQALEARREKTLPVIVDILQAIIYNQDRSSIIIINSNI